MVFLLSHDFGIRRLFRKKRAFFSSPLAIARSFAFGVGLMVFLAACSKNPCIDTDKIDNSVFCPTSYAPVCGCDNITYTNECVAQKRGVSFYSSGACL